MTNSIPQFYVIGIAVRTTNENAQAATDIPALWNRFFTENIQNQIPNKIDDAVYSIYTDYESDFKKPYTTILGCKVSSLIEIPDGMVAKTITQQNYQQFTAKGKLSDGIVYNQWTQIWESGMNRKYTADFEIYDADSSNPDDAKVNIYIAV